MPRHKTRRHQPRVEGGREALPACVLHEIHEKVDRIAFRYNVSRSWVIATILADALGVADQPSYTTAERLKKTG